MSSQQPGWWLGQHASTAARQARRWRWQGVCNAV